MRAPATTRQPAGTAVWLDQLSREILRAGKLEALMDNAAMTGVTSNPAIFEKAISGSQDYDNAIRELAAADKDKLEIYETLEAQGAVLGVGAGAHTTSVSAKGLTEDFGSLLDLASDVMINL